MCSCQGSEFPERDIYPLQLRGYARRSSRGPDAHPVERTTRAGPSPATPHRARPERRPAGPRATRAGVAPATPDRLECRAQSCRGSRNEGRVEPRRTRNDDIPIRARRDGRTTRAGWSPATLRSTTAGWTSGSALNEGWGPSPGNALGDQFLAQSVGRCATRARPSPATSCFRIR